MRSRVVSKKPWLTRGVGIAVGIVINGDREQSRMKADDRIAARMTRL